MFVGVFVLLCFFLVIYYLVGACKGLRRGYLSVTSIRNTRSEKLPLSSAFFLRMLLISSSVGPSCSARALISSRRSDSSSSLSGFVLLRCILLFLLLFSCRFLLCIRLRVGFLLLVFFRWILLFVGFCSGLVCCRLACGFLRWFFLDYNNVCLLKFPSLYS